MEIMPYYYSGHELLEILIAGMFLFMMTTLFAIFSPLGIGFIVFSVIRAKTKNKKLRKASFIIQIVLASLTAVAGIIIGVLLTVIEEQFFILLSILLATVFIAMIEVGIIVWQSLLKK